ncbi:28S ribosomal protein S7, mitochondrial [Armadillidium nasatum]|uniref:28S ribosomal protein S7, mitochondrial n=1 Tax=Armadillidium nasatum TaxID=96803 RepID=A0A5N5TPJ5_9CRUS|nr:28S ribosomal protein S7, mitochondrial [Armadillidium nasatum]
MALFKQATTFLGFSIPPHKKLTAAVKSVLSCRTAYFPAEFQKPITDQDVLKELEDSSEFENLKFQPFLPAPISLNSSVFYDEFKERFTRYVMKGGQKKLARELLEKTFYEIKKIQLKKYYEAETDSERNEIECNPLVILKNAIENCTPMLTVKKVSRGGSVYQVPVPVQEKKAEYLSIKWMLEAARDKGSRVHLPIKLSKELIDAHNGEGRVIKKKQDLHKLCEANRAYAHFRWS